MRKITKKNINLIFLCFENKDKIDKNAIKQTSGMSKINRGLETCIKKKLLKESRKAVINLPPQTKVSLWVGISENDPNTKCIPDIINEIKIIE